MPHNWEEELQFISRLLRPEWNCVHLYVEANYPEQVEAFAKANRYDVSIAPNLNVVMRPCPLPT